MVIKGLVRGTVKEPVSFDGVRGLVDAQRHQGCEPNVTRIVITECPDDMELDRARNLLTEAIKNGEVILQWNR